MNQQSIGTENAIALGNTGWHNLVTPELAVLMQLNIAELCIPTFLEFQRLTEIALNRLVFTHEFADPELLLNELVNIHFPQLRQH
jgi:hypothetical protein